LPRIGRARAGSAERLPSRATCSWWPVADRTIWHRLRCPSASALEYCSLPIRTLHQWSKTTTEAIVAGAIGSISQPDALLLGRLDQQDRLRYVGRTHPLTPAQRAELAGALTPAVARRRGGVDHPWPRPLPASWTGQLGATGPLDYRQVQPAVVAEVRIDTAYEHGWWRHMAHHVRIRTDMSIYEVPLVDTDGEA
jgi:hypothetical protein